MTSRGPDARWAVSASASRLLLLFRIPRACQERAGIAPCSPGVYGCDGDGPVPIGNRRAGRVGGPWPPLYAFTACGTAAVQNSRMACTALRFSSADPMLMRNHPLLPYISACGRMMSPRFWA